MAAVQAAEFCIVITRGQMMVKRVLIAAVMVVAATAAWAQDGRWDVSANEAAVFSRQTTGNGISQSATAGSNLFGTIRYKFRPRHSVLFNYGRTLNSQIYQSDFDFHVGTHMTEYTGAYMYSPFKKGRFEPFAFVGGGAIRFNPQSTWVDLPEITDPSTNTKVPNNVQTNVGAVKETQPAFLYGLGVDYKLPRVRWFALRLQYRGLLYDNPDFKVNGATGSNVSFFTGTKGHMAEPSIGLVFRF
jgi:hypothetical protein